MQASVLQEPDIDAVCENITKKAGEELSETEPKPTGQQHFHPHHPHRHGHHHRRHHHHHHHDHVGSHDPKHENHQAASETVRHHPHSSWHHKVFGHHRHDQIGSQEPVDTVPPGEIVEIAQDKKLQKKGKNSCKNQLT